jgi:hypothetical protein
VTTSREFDCIRDRLRIGDKWIRLNEQDLVALSNAERKDLLPPGFFEKARKGMDGESAITYLLTAVRNSVSAQPAALVDLLVLLLNRKVEQGKSARPIRHAVSAPQKGVTPSGRLFRR